MKDTVSTIYREELNPDGTTTLYYFPIFAEREKYYLVDPAGGMPQHPQKKFQVRRRVYKGGSQDCQSPEAARVELVARKEAMLDRSVRMAITAYQQVHTLFHLEGRQKDLKVHYKRYGKTLVAEKTRRETGVESTGWF